MCGYSFQLQRSDPRIDDHCLGGRGYSWEFLVGVCCPVLKILTLLQTNNVIFHTRFQTKKEWARPFSLVFLLRLEQQQKKVSGNTFRIRIFLFLSYSFGIVTINTFIHSVVPSKTIPDSRPKWAKSIYTLFLGLTCANSGKIILRIAAKKPYPLEQSPITGLVVPHFCYFP